MKTRLAALVVCAAILLTTAARQGPPSSSERQPLPDVTLTGCLIQGSAPSVFLFSHARKFPKDKNDKGTWYLVVNRIEGTDLKPHLNHEVELVGQIELKMPPVAGPKVEEKDLPKFIARSLTIVSDTCTPAPQD